MRPESLQGEIGQHDHPARARRLWLLQDQLTANLLKCVSDGDGSRAKVNVLPPKREQFALPKTRADCKRVGRSLSHLLELVEDLRGRGIGLQSLTEAIDTGTPAGKLVYSILGAIAEFERELIRERVTAGLQAAKGRGERIGASTSLDALTERFGAPAR